MKMIQFLKKELKEEISDNPWAFYVITLMTVPTVLVSIACFFDDPWAFCVIMFMIAFTVLVAIACYFDSMEEYKMKIKEFRNTKKKTGVKRRHKKI